MYFKMLKELSHSGPARKNLFEKFVMGIGDWIHKYKIIITA